MHERVDEWSRRTKKMQHKGKQSTDETGWRGKNSQKDGPKQINDNRHRKWKTGTYLDPYVFSHKSYKSILSAP